MRMTCKFYRFQHSKRTAEDHPNMTQENAIEKKERVHIAQHVQKRWISLVHVDSSSSITNIRQEYYVKLELFADKRTACKRTKRRNRTPNQFRFGAVFRNRRYIFRKRKPFSTTMGLHHGLHLRRSEVIVLYDEISSRFPSS